MRKGRQLTEQEKVETARQICEQYATNNYTIANCCENAGISYSTFDLWSKTIGEVGELYTQAKEENNLNYKRNLVERARTALEKMVEGYTVMIGETVIEYDANGDVLRTKEKRAERHVPPSPVIASRVLANFDGGNWRETIESRIDFSKLSPEEQEAALERLAEKLRFDE